MLTLQHVSKRYGKTLACDDLNFTLEDGSLTVLLGPNGAGKSTAMKSIIGFLRFDGQITINGYENSSEEARKILGYIPEIPALYPNLTVNEHMEFVARAYKLANYRQRIDELLTIFELDDKRKKFGDELSKGMQQKLSICLGLLPEPQVLLLDEPMIGLDPHAIKQLKTYLQNMSNQGKILLVSTHIIDSIDMLWDRTIIMQAGKVKADIGKEDLDSQNKSLEEFFFEVTEGVDSESMKEEEA